MRERIKTSVSEKLAKRWITTVSLGNDVYLMEIGKALEANDPVAMDFLNKAGRIDPKFVERYFPGFNGKPNP